MTMNHTPTPWAVTSDSTQWHYIHGTEGAGIIAEVHKRSNVNNEGLANAAFIVKACNAHEDLVAILTEARNQASDACAVLSPTEEKGFYKNTVHDVKDAVRTLLKLQKDINAALAKAQL